MTGVVVGVAAGVFLAMFIVFWWARRDTNEMLRRRDQKRCYGCGYSLRGLDDGKCPECGRPFSRGP